MADDFCLQLPTFKYVDDTIVIETVAKNESIQYTGLLLAYEPKWKKTQEMIIGLPR